MPKFCANLSMMFTELPFLDRFEAARKAGFSAVEFLFPYAFEASELRTRLDASGLSQVLFNLPPGDWDRGERGTACLPGRTDEFRAGIERGLDYASRLGCRMLHCMAGIVPPGMALAEAEARYVANLAWAAETAASAGVLLVIEPINQTDMPGYLLRTQEAGAAIVAALGRDRVGLQFDIYHCQIAQGDVTRRMEALSGAIAHMQLADVPGRHEPGTGEIGWDFVLGRVDAIGYAGWIGCEYRPAGGTVEGLAWLSRFARAPA